MKKFLAKIQGFLDKIYAKFGASGWGKKKAKEEPSKKPEAPKVEAKTPEPKKATAPKKKKKFLIFEKKDPKEKAEKKEVEDTTIKSVKQVPKGNQKDDSTQRYLPFSEIRDNIMVMKDGSVRMVIKVDTVNFNLKSEEEQDSIIYSYQSFLNSLQFPIQILVRSLKVDIEWYIDRLNTIASGQSNQLLKEQTIRYIEFLNNLVDMAQIMKKEFYIIVPHDETDNSSVRSTSLFQFVTHFWEGINQGQDVSKIRANLSRLERMRRRIHEKTNQIRGSLEYVGLQSQVLKKEELIELLMWYYNPKLNTLARIGDTMAHVDVEGR